MTHYIKYAAYLIFSIIGGGIMSKIIPHTEMWTMTCWCMLGNILFEILEWKYNSASEEKE